MSLMVDIIVSLNSCLHDIAVAFLAVGLSVVRILSMKYPASGDTAGVNTFLSVYKAVGRITNYSFSLIIFTAAAMAVYLTREGSAMSLGHLQIVAISVKYGIMLALAGIGLFIWSGLSKKVSRLRSK